MKKSGGQNKRKTLVMTLFLILFSASSGAGEVKVYLDESRTKFIRAKKMDCRVYKSKKGITLGFKVGSLLLGMGPEITFGGENSIKWDKTVQSIILRYQELCARFNTGAMIKEEYDKRIREIDAIGKEAMELQEKMKDKVKKEAGNAFGELAREVERRGDTRVDISEGIDGLSGKLERLSPISTVEEPPGQSHQNFLKNSRLHE